MKRILNYTLLALMLLLGSCSNAQTPNNHLSATDFAAKIKELPSAPLLDVRTAEEFSKGHLQNAKNIDWNGGHFDQQIANMDKSKPVFVYCLSGGRSGAAANKMRSEGFKEVYELNGGIMKWRGANLPETIDSAPIATAGMTMQQFESLLVSDKLVLIDFYADWCAPCKMMKPYLDEIKREMVNKVIVIRINADNNKDLCKALKVDALPFLYLYKNKKLSWVNEGYIEKAEIIRHLQ
jgi:thioredoxin 1